MGLPQKDVCSINILNKYHIDDLMLQIEHCSGVSTYDAFPALRAGGLGSMCFKAIPRPLWPLNERERI